MDKELVTFRDGVEGSYLVVNGEIRREDKKLVFEPTNYDIVPENVYFNITFVAENPSYQKYVECIKSSLAQKILKGLQ
jgi:hypothetical protein